MSEQHAQGQGLKEKREEKIREGEGREGEGSGEKRKKGRGGEERGDTEDLLGKAGLAKISGNRWTQRRTAVWQTPP